MYKFLLLTLLIIIFVSTPPIYGEERTINIIYTGGLQGELEPCGCSPQSDFGGLARFSGFLNDHGESLSPYILIDAGNSLAKDSAQGRLKADAMLESFGILKYDATALLPDAEAVAEEVIIPLIDEYKVRTLSFRPGASQSVLLKKGSVEINVSIDPVECPEDKINILLTNHPVTAASGIKGWDVIITSSGEIVEEPLKIDNTLVTSGYPKGEKFGVLTLTINRTGEIVHSRHEWIPLGNEIDEDERVRKVLNKYDIKVARYYKESVKPLPGSTYLGVSGCAECHQPYVDSWEKTPHSHAYASLEKVGKSSDPECIVCHSVGFAEKGGFFSLEATPGLANVQCEECHGLNREHVSDFSEMRPVTETVCLKCHTKANSPEFNYSEYFNKIKH
jgi:hypothetical protein